MAISILLIMNHNNSQVIVIVNYTSVHLKCIHVPGFHLICENIKLMYNSIFAFCQISVFSQYCYAIVQLLYVHKPVYHL